MPRIPRRWSVEEDAVLREEVDTQLASKSERAPYKPTLAPG
jgi:hypothetical protein